MATKKKELLEQDAPVTETVMSESETLLVDTAQPESLPADAGDGLDLNELLVHRPAATFFVRAAGDSMTGAGIRPGDILVVDRSLEARDGSIVIACVDNEFTVKFLRSDGERWYLQPANRKYKPITFSEGMELRIFGVVTAVIHQFVKLSNGKGT